MRLDLTTLKIFLAVFEEGNIGRAAEREHIAASAVSKRIHDLEAEVGVELLHRHAKGVTPTAGGRALAAHARNLFGVIERMRGEMSEHAAGVRGHVRVHANGSAIVEFLMQDLREFMATYPLVTIDLCEELSVAAMRSVRDGVADVGIFANNVEVPTGVRTYPYRTDQLLAVVPLTHPFADRIGIRFEEILDFGLIGVHEGSSLAGLLTEAAAALKRQIRFNFTVTTNEVVRLMVEADLGIAVLPEGFVRRYERGMRIRGVPLTDTWAQRRLDIAVRETGITVPARLLLEHLTRRPAATVPASANAAA